MSNEDQKLNPPPQHVAIIMDGNNRWAKKRGLPGIAGHKAGVEKIREILEACRDNKIPHLTLFAFSSENWQRPPKEVEALMRLFLNYLTKEAKKLAQNKVRLQVIGSRQRFSTALNKAISHAEELTAAEETNTVLTIAADYGGRWDITQAAKALAQQVKDNKLQPEAITEEHLQKYISLSDLPPPDLCIRTGGESRISNFLLWQFAYTELFFEPCYWPDFDKEAFSRALSYYASRQRRFGLTGDQVSGDRPC